MIKLKALIAFLLCCALAVVVMAPIQAPVNGKLMECIHRCSATYWSQTQQCNFFDNDCWARALDTYIACVGRCPGLYERVI